MKVEEYLKKENSFMFKGYLFKLVKRTLLSMIILLAILITCNLNSEFKNSVKHYVFETDFNFSKINAIYQKYILDLKKETDKVTTLVSKNKEIDYKEEIEENDGVTLLVGENYAIKALESGLVTQIEEDKIKVQQSNGIDVIYSNVIINDIKIYDYIEKNTLIGTSKTDRFHLSFYKNGEVIDYKPYIKY